MKTKIISLIGFLCLCTVSFSQVNGFPKGVTSLDNSDKGIVVQLCYNGKPSFYNINLLDVYVPSFISSYQPPVVSTFVKKINQNQTLRFTQRDFITSFVSADNEILASIRIESLPFHGKIKLADVEVSKDQVILLADLKKLEFYPDMDYTGVTSFRWVASDGNEYSVSSANVIIVVVQQEIFVPEGFSPNGDGINDCFVISGADQYTISLRVFNRWGTKVYENYHYMNNWDGTANVGSLASSKLPEGTYFFVINFHNGEKDLYGYLTLNR